VILNEYVTFSHHLSGVPLWWGQLLHRFEAKRFLLGTRNFLLHWSVHRDAPRQAIQQHLRSDTLTGSALPSSRRSRPTECLTSTGSLDSPDAPRRVVQKAKSFVLPLRVRHSLFGETTKTGMPHQTKLVLRIDGFMYTQSFSMQPPTNCHGSVPFPTYALRARYANALFTCIAVRLCRVVSGSADRIMVAHIYIICYHDSN
jgi:hypothetical protein